MVLSYMGWFTDKYRQKCFFPKCAGIVEDALNRKKLRDYIGEENPDKKREVNRALYKAFDKALLKERKTPEYQHYFPIYW